MTTSITTSNYVGNVIDNTFTREVVKMPLFGPDNMPTPHYGLCFEDAEGKDDWVSFACKKNYVPHTKQDVKDLCMAVVEGFNLTADEVKVAATFAKGRGHVVSIRPTDAYRRQVHGTDTLIPTLVVRAYYGGAFTASVGLKRDVCSNLMMLRNVDKTTVNLRHTRNFHDVFAETVESFRNLIAMSDNIVEAARQLNSQKMNIQDFFSDVMPADPTASKRAQDRQHDKIGKMIRRIYKERLDLSQDDRDPSTATLWELCNAVQGYCQHDKSRWGKQSQVERAFTALSDPQVDRTFAYAFDQLAA